MESRIISIYCHHHPTEYWYDIDGFFRNNKVLTESQMRGNRKMQINSNDEIYILCRYQNNMNEIKYRCRVIETDINSINEEDSYEHNANENSLSPCYFKAELIDVYEDGNFPLEILRELNLVSNHYQLNGDRIQQPLLDHIEQYKRTEEIN